MIKGIIDNAPSVDIMNIQPDRFATTVYDADGNLTETLVTSGSNRESATYEELPENLVNAFVAIEDSRFWTHDGIDLRSIARAVKGVVSDDYSGGGSTITQQVIKNTYLTQERTFTRKIVEILLAPEIEKKYSKADIMEFYCNTNFYGHQCYGVEAASLYYFGKHASGDPHRYQQQPFCL